MCTCSCLYMYVCAYIIFDIMTRNVIKLYKCIILYKCTIISTQ